MYWLTRFSLYFVLCQVAACLVIATVSCPDAFARETCVSVHYSAPSGPANDITFKFDQPYPCGQFANGDWFVAPAQSGGKVNVIAIEPAFDNERNGWDVNPDIRNVVYQSFDGRVPQFRAPPPMPYAATAESSIIKVVASLQCQQTCVKFAAVLTVLDGAPDGPEKLFRPPALGSVKRLFSTTNLQTARLPHFSAACCPQRPNAAIALARSIGFRNNWSPNSVWGYEIVPSDNVNGRPWGGDIWLYDTEVMGYLMLDFPMSEKLPVLIAYVQQGIDIWGANKFAGASWYRGGGGNGAGALATYAFAAAMLHDPSMIADLKNADMHSFLEATDFYRGRGGIALYGATTPYDDEKSYWDGVKKGDASTRTLRDPHGYIDGGPVPGSFYEGTLANQVSYMSILLRAFPAYRDAWPNQNDNAAVIIDFGKRYHESKTLTLPDPCAPPKGTYGVDYGPNGKSHDGFLDCIPGNGRFPALNGSDRTNRSSIFMASFYDYVDRALLGAGRTGKDGRQPH